jgi:hypothetical protein
MSALDLLPGLDARYLRFYELAIHCKGISCPDEFYAYRDSCSVETCPLASSFFEYRPSLAANGVFIALFSLSLVGYLGQALILRNFLGFAVCMVGGCILEVLGYIGRIMSYYNPWNQVRLTREEASSTIDNLRFQPSGPG